MQPHPITYSTATVSKSGISRSLAAVALCAASLPAQAFIINTGLDLPPVGMSGGLRWDAAPRLISGDDRSLTGGISWNVQGGSFGAYKSNFSWGGATPSDAAFEGLIRQAFDFWTSPDPNPLLPYSAPFSFVYDSLRTTTADPLTGAEIDFLVEDMGFSGSAGGALSSPILNDTLTLTSGTTGYASDVIGGVDIKLNIHTGTTYTQAGFRTLLTHEIGHALGMGHASLGLVNRYFDDNYDGTSEATANATLNNAFSHLINPLDPSNSPGLALYTVPNNTSGTGASGVHIIMERFLSPQMIQAANPITADDYAQRQFLYPVNVPEPSSIGLLALSLIPLLGRRQTGKARP